MCFSFLTFRFPTCITKISLFFGRVKEKSTSKPEVRSTGVSRAVPESRHLQSFERKMWNMKQTGIYDIYIFIHMTYDMYMIIIHVIFYRGQWWSSIWEDFLLCSRILAIVLGFIIKLQWLWFTKMNHSLCCTRIAVVAAVVAGTSISSQTPSSISWPGSWLTFCWAYPQFKLHEIPILSWYILLFSGWYIFRFQSAGPVENDQLACKENVLIAGTYFPLHHGGGGKLSQNNQPEL